MKMVIKFDCDNAAFESQRDGTTFGYSEISWILKKLADKMESYEDNEPVQGAIVDSNGYKIGFYERK